MKHRCDVIREKSNVMTYTEIQSKYNTMSACMAMFYVEMHPKAGCYIRI